MTQPPNYPGDDQGGFPQDPQNPQNPQNPQQGGFPPPPHAQGFPPPQGGQGFPPPQDPGYGQQGGAQGFPPPQDPGYGQGGFPPPPQGGQGFPPPPQGGYPPPPGGFGGPQFGGQQPFNIGDAFTWAWNKFTKNALALIVSVLIYALIMSAIVGIGYFLVFSIILGTSSTDADGFTTVSTGGSIGAVVGMAVMVLVAGIVGYIVQAAFYSGLLDIADGKQVTIGSFFAPRNTGQVVLAAIIIGVVTAVLSLIPILGYIFSIVIGFLVMFTIPVLVDRGVPAVEGIKQGFAIIQRDIGNSLLTYVIAAIIGFVGACLCGVGLLVAGPVAALLVTYAYRRLSGGQVAPLTP